jgi:UDPglucose 6-dehydrogenase
MIIGVIGHGVVGGAVAAGMRRLGHDVRIHDLKLGTDIDVVSESEIVFICVPTPQKADGSCHTGIVEDVVGQLIDGIGFKGIIAIKSTVTPGTTEKLAEKYGGKFPGRNIAFVPEFLREKSAFYDFTEGHDLLIVGTTNYGWSEETADKIIAAHGHYPTTVAKMSSTEAELAKYYSNVFNALRITFANGFFDVCNKLNANYTRIKNAMVQRPTIENFYLDVNDNFRGFAGVCLPKDTAAFAQLAFSLGVQASIFKSIVEDNKLYKPTVPQGMRLDYPIVGENQNQVVS